MSATNAKVVLVRRTSGIAAASDFRIEYAALEPIADGQILVRNRFLSVEPAMRGWIADTAGYSAPVPIGSVMRSLAAGEVIESRNPSYAPGDLVTGWFGWQHFASVDVSAVVRRVLELDLPLSLSLGVLGMNGLTAYLALTKIGRPASGETVVVSTAAGAVGSAVGQIARRLGCRTVGITGSDDKVQQCIDSFGYDVAFNYRTADLDAELDRACPAGVQVYFDNTSGPISDDVHRRLAIGARVVLCGTASVPDWSDWPLGPRVERRLIVKRALMQGFLVFDHAAEFESTIGLLANWVRAGELHAVEDILDGIESCPDAIAGLYRGDNRGKRLIRV
jgi:NADPH-dependent curcumin reductase CurA